MVIIATEGRKTERKYFEDLAVLHHNSHIKVHIIEKLDNKSSPDDVIDQLDDFTNQYSLEEDDSLWLVIDVDRWGEKKLSAIATQCIQKKYGLAISNPCFELWLLLHIKDPTEYSAETLQELKTNKKIECRTRLEMELSDLIGGYDKSNLQTNKFLPFVKDAVSRAKSLDVHPGHRWPNKIGSRVYLIVEQIIGKNS